MSARKLLQIILILWISEAMLKNKQNVGSRYVELFLRSKDDRGSWPNQNQNDDYAWGGDINQPPSGRRGGGGGYGGGGRRGRGGGYGGGNRDW